MEIREKYQGNFEDLGERDKNALKIYEILLQEMSTQAEYQKWLTPIKEIIADEKKHVRICTQMIESLKSSSSK